MCAIYFRYAIPPEQGHRFERAASGFFPYDNQQCRTYLRHKTIYISPVMLKKYYIPFNKVRNH